MNLAIRDALIVTQNEKREVIRGDLLVEDGFISQVGTVDSAADREIDAGGDILIPGLINTHNHVSMSLMKGMVDDIPFEDFLERTFEVDGRRGEEDLAAGASLGLLEMIRGGTTTFVDLYYSQDIIAKEVERAGIRGVLCWAVLNEEFTTQSGTPLDNCRRFLDDYGDSELIVPGVGPQGVYVCSEGTLRGARELADEKGAPLTVHLSETRKEVYEFKERTGERPGEHLHRIGFLGPGCIAAHSAWLTLSEVRMLASSGTSVSTCPVSNMKLATGGLPPLPEMMESGVNVSLGTDGSSTNNSLDMFGEMKTLSLLHKCFRWDSTVLPCQQVLDIATVNGARALGWGDRLGSIEEGKMADLVLVDGQAPNMVPSEPRNVVSNLVYSCSSHDVKTVICNGKVIMQDRSVLTMDEKEVKRRAEGAVRHLTDG
ncbi:MAG: amidohydrolase family protein [Methanomassiliicoccales archaeon]